MVRPVDIKEDILQCDSAELSFALSHFIREVRRPNGETYSPDSIFYLCLGIQQVHMLSVPLPSNLIHIGHFQLILSFLAPFPFGQYLFTNGRIENIFTDGLYSQFAAEISGMLRLWKPNVLPTGMTIEILLLDDLLNIQQLPLLKLQIPC